MAVIALTLTVAACGDSATSGSTAASPSTGTPSACASTGPPISLGFPALEGAIALFTSDGSELLFAADGFRHGGLLEPKVGSASVYVGNPDRMPVDLPASGSLTNMTHQFVITEGQVTSQTLPAGRYWLLTSKGVRVTVRSCPPGGVTLLPSRQGSTGSAGQTPSPASSSPS